MKRESVDTMSMNTIISKMLQDFYELLLIKLIGLMLLWNLFEHIQGDKNLLPINKKQYENNTRMKRHSN